MNTVSKYSFKRFFNAGWQLFPGLAVCIAIALVTTFIADHYGGPTLLYALLFGMGLSFLAEDKRCLPGVGFASRTVLRLGVALLGVRITLEDVAVLGIGPLLIVVSGVILTIVMGAVLARMLGLGREMGLLTGGAVAICGASAALALSAVMPRSENQERNTLMTVVGVTALSTLAMIVYPLLVSVLGWADSEAGIFLGGTIHDVAQVVGAGYMISDDAGDVATFVKLLRVAMLVPAVLVFIFIFRGSDQQARQTKVPVLPGFLVAFVIIVLINSLGWIPGLVTGTLTELSRWCMVAAIAALGIKTSFKDLAVVGWKPVLLMFAETLFLLLFVMTCIHFGLGGL